MNCLGFGGATDINSLTSNCAMQVLLGIAVNRKKKMWMRDGQACTLLCYTIVEGVGNYWDTINTINYHINRIGQSCFIAGHAFMWHLWFIYFLLLCTAATCSERDLPHSIYLLFIIQHYLLAQHQVKKMMTQVSWQDQQKTSDESCSWSCWSPHFTPSTWLNTIEGCFLVLGERVLQQKPWSCWCSAQITVLRHWFYVCCVTTAHLTF